ncbi:Short-chain dehydrogenase/reductase family protein [Mycena venus]|uniref:Short-chain dehydrogenase/reductase family protein n=1 Tax=Mycena venus TaxID=2733690 RepID=A0A8H6XZW4_9AGAR|nr:Short-chain dehydrogenase/reductase family protein [Mycena venus]
MASLLTYLFRPAFLPERDIPDLSGKSTSLPDRSEKASDAIKRLEDETKKSAIFLRLDLADLPSVRRAAESFLERESRLDLLFNNGGVMISPNEMLTAQGHDLQFGTNVIGHFFLTELLLPALMKTHPETKVPARIINTSSIGHQFAPGKGVEFASLKGGPERDAWLKAAGSLMGPWYATAPDLIIRFDFLMPALRRLYGESKLSNIFISNYFARAHADVLVSCAVHPGFINTELGRHSGSIMQAAGSVFFYPPPMGAYTQLWGATMASPDEINGQYLVPWGTVGKADVRASDRELEDEVIAYIREQIKGF